MSNQVTLKDIAKQLGVSISTVSRSLQDHPEISTLTKKRVMNLVNRLNYRPNQFALNLKNNKSSTIGVLIPEIVHHFFSTVISGIMHVADERGYSVMLFQSNESLARESREAKVMFRNRVDGLLISLSNETENIDHLQDFVSNAVPLVFFDKVLENIVGSKVVIDDFNAAYLVVKHLIAEGNSRIAYIRGPLEPLNSKLRYEGYAHALQEDGLSLDNDLIRICKEVSQDEGHRFAMDLLSQKYKPDAIFAATDVVALGCLQAIKELGLNVPEDIALVGFSDWRIAAALEPPLTTVSQPGFEMGACAAEVLFDQILKKEKGESIKHQTHTLETSLVVRKSSKKRD